MNGAARVRLYGLNGKASVSRGRVWSSAVRVLTFEDPPEEEEPERWEVRGAPSHGLQGWVSSKGRTAVLDLGEIPGPTIYGQ